MFFFNMHDFSPNNWEVGLTSIMFQSISWRVDSPCTEVCWYPFHWLPPYCTLGRGAGRTNNSRENHFTRLKSPEDSESGVLVFWCLSKCRVVDRAFEISQNKTEDMYVAEWDLFPQLWPEHKEPRPDHFTNHIDNMSNHIATF